VALFRGTEDRLGLAWSLFCLGNAAELRGDPAAGQALHEESLNVSRALGSRWGVAIGLIGLGNSAARRGEHAAAYELFAQGLALQREDGLRYLSDTLNALGRAALSMGEPVRAADHFREALALAGRQGSRFEAAVALEGLAEVALAAGCAPRAARLLGAAAAIRAALATALPPAERADFERRVAATKAVLGEPAFAAGWDEGAALAFERAVAAGLTEAST
jgi:tetratricopeptide (TPR) repeat protein